jgi:very-short-patch-repair endonuclease
VQQAIANAKLLTCQYCGKSFTSVSARFLKQRHCSHKCAGSARQERNKKSWQAKIIAFLQQKGSYGTIHDITEGLTCSDKVLYGFGLSVPELNFQAGTGPCPAASRYRNSIELEKDIHLLLVLNGWLSQPVICEHLGIDKWLLQHRNVSISKLRKKLELRKPSRYSRQGLTERIVTWLKLQQQFCGTAQILKAMHIDFDSTWQALLLSAEELNKEAGFEDPLKSWYEEYTVKTLGRMIPNRQIVREKRFEECRSFKQKNNRLRFDFYITSWNILIEVDGSQHTDKQNPYWTPQLTLNDKVKDEFAKKQNVPLFRIRCCEREQFKEQLDLLLTFCQQLATLSNGDCKTY